MVFLISDIEPDILIYMLLLSVCSTRLRCLEYWIIQGNVAILVALVISANFSTLISMTIFTNKFTYQIFGMCVVGDRWLFNLLGIDQWQQIKERIFPVA